MPVPSKNKSAPARLHFPASPGTLISMITLVKAVLASLHPACRTTHEDNQHFLLHDGQSTASLRT